MLPFTIYFSRSQLGCMRSARPSLLEHVQPIWPWQLNSDLVVKSEHCTQETTMQSLLSVSLIPEWQQISSPDLISSIMAFLSDSFCILGSQLSHHYHLWWLLTTAKCVQTKRRKPREAFSQPSLLGSLLPCLLKSFCCSPCVSKLAPLQLISYSVLFPLLDNTMFPIQRIHHCLVSPKPIHSPASAMNPNPPFLVERLSHSENACLPPILWLKL